LGPVLLIWTSASIYRELTTQKELPMAFNQMLDAINNPKSLLFFLLAFCMMPVNWLLETFKWYLLLKQDAVISFKKCMVAVLGGLALSMNTPNRIGEFFGRILYLEKENRFSGINYSIISGLSQLLMTLMAGWIALYYLTIFNPLTINLSGLANWIFLPILRWVLLFIILMIVVVYFYYASVVRFLGIKRLLSRFSFFNPHIPAISHRLLFHILLISILRFVIFTTQYILIWKAFGLTFGYIQGGAIVSVIYLVMAIIPTITIAELGIRGKVALLIAGLFTNQLLEITAGTVMIWILNLMLPAIAGTFFLWNLK
jgi:hypothetical protein